MEIVLHLPLLGVVGNGGLGWVVGLGFGFCVVFGLGFTPPPLPSPEEKQTITFAVVEIFRKYLIHLLTQVGSFPKMLDHIVQPGKKEIFDHRIKLNSYKSGLFKDSLRLF